MAEPAISSLSLSIVDINTHSGHRLFTCLLHLGNFLQLACRSTRIIGAAPAAYKHGFRLLERLLNPSVFLDLPFRPSRLVAKLLKAIATAR